MKYFNRTLQDLWVRSDLVQSKAVAACHAVRWHKNTAYAQQAVANHRAQSKDLRAALKQLMDKLDSDDNAVEEAFKETRSQTRYLCGEILLGKKKFRVVIDMQLKKLLQVEWWWFSRYNWVADADLAVIESQIIVNGQVTVTPTGEGLTLRSKFPDWAM